MDSAGTISSVATDKTFTPTVDNQPLKEVTVEEDTFQFLIDSAKAVTSVEQVFQYFIDDNHDFHIQTSENLACFLHCLQASITLNVGSPYIMYLYPYVFWYILSHFTLHLYPSCLIPQFPTGQIGHTIWKRKGFQRYQHSLAHQEQVPTCQGIQWCPPLLPGCLWTLRVCKHGIYGCLFTAY